MSNDSPPQFGGHRLKRRQFLANLLFAGGALSLASLQGALAHEQPIEEGWVLPKDLEDKLNSPSSQLDPAPKPSPPQPTGSPPPCPPSPNGGLTPAPPSQTHHIGGAVAPPSPPKPPCPPVEGGRTPLVNGKAAVPEPPKR